MNEIEDRSKEKIYQETKHHFNKVQSLLCEAREMLEKERREDIKKLSSSERGNVIQDTEEAKEMISEIARFFK